MASISVALATHNGEPYLEEQLDSFTRQVRLPDELVVWDDASTDASMAVLERFEGSAPFPVEIYRGDDPVGPVQNFERVLSSCRSELILLSDQDDVWFPGKIAEIEKVAADRPALLYVNDLVNLLPDGSISRGSFLERLKREGVSDRWLVKGCATAVHARLLDVVLPIPEGFSHDDWLHGVAATLESRHVVRRVLQAYRVHPGQHSGDQPRSRRSLMRLLRGRGRRASEDVSRRLRELEVIDARLGAVAGERWGEELGLDVGAGQARVWGELERFRARQSHLEASSALRRGILVARELGRGRRGAYRDLEEAIRDVFLP